MKKKILVVAGESNSGPLALATSAQASELRQPIIGGVLSTRLQQAVLLNSIKVKCEGLGSLLFFTRAISLSHVHNLNC